MTSLARPFKFITCRNTNILFSCINSHVRTFADTPKTGASSKQVAVLLDDRIVFKPMVVGLKFIGTFWGSKFNKVQGTKNEERLRVRRARASDVPRVLKFVREHATTAWPGLITPPSVSSIVVCDYVSRALAQGHSMIAEQQEARRAWSQIKGLAIGVSVCPWDASLLESWAHCVRCTKSRRLMFFTAYCLRAPALHNKYNVHNILQVILMVPENTPRSTEVVQILAKNAIQRGRDVGFPLLRFDVTDANIAKSLENLQLKKEWQLAYNRLPGAIKETDTHKNITEKPLTADDAKKTETIKAKTQDGKNFITVYTALTQSKKESQ